MTEAMIKGYQNRIVNASKADLLLINYELLMLSIDEAIEALDTDVHLFGKQIIKAQKYLRELTDNLDFKYTLSRDLMAIYIYVNKQFIEASIHFSKESLENAKGVLKTLLLGFEQVSDEGHSAPVVKNSQQVYAGLTYGKGKLNETVYQDSSVRGFKA